MKRLLITLLLALLAVAAVVLWRERPRLFPSSKVSDLYLRYEHNPHIRTTEIHDFPVDDTLAVDALLLQADTDSAWYVLMADFGMPEELIEEYRTNIKLTQKPTVSIFTIDKNNLKKRPPRYDTDSRVVSMSYAKKSFCVFLSEDINVKKSIVYSETVKVSKKNINQQKQKRK